MTPSIKRLISSFVALALAFAGVLTGFSAPANATGYTYDYSTAGLHEMDRKMGHYQASTDGIGSITGAGDLRILKPTGATTVVAAYLMSGGRDYQNQTSAEPTVTLGGSAVAFTGRAHINNGTNPWSGSFTNYFADVTSQVQAFMATSPSGTAETAPWAGTKYSIPVTFHANNSSTLDDPAGVGLTVIFANPTMTNDASVVVYFGTSNSTGQDFPLTFQTLPNSQVGSWLSFGIAWSAGGGQYSNIRANTNLNATYQMLSGSAGGYDDGSSTGDSLLTVGGVGDSSANPANPTAGDGQADDELYNLDAFLGAGVNQVNMNMTNPSGDDNIFQAAISVPFILTGSAGSTHTVTYDAQNSTTNTVVNYVTTVNNFIANPSRSGYTFNGWFNAASGGVALTAPYTPGSFADITLYAQWTQVTHTVTYDTQGGSAVSGGTYTGTITLPVSNPTKSGYTFNGWFVAASGGSALSGSTYTPGSFADITLYAQWTQVTHTVTYDTQGGSAVSGGTYTGTITLPVSNPTKSGYTFNGWFVAASGGSALSGSTYTPGSFADITLYAQWTQVTHTVTYDSQGGSAVSGGTYTGTITLPVSNPTKSGYTFNGWFVAASGGSALSGSTYTPGSFADITLYAQWTAVSAPPAPPAPVVPTYLVKFDSQGGSAVGSITYAYSFSLPAAPIRAGYTFNGWFVQKSGGVALVSPQSPNVPQDMELYAQWTQVTHTVTYDTQGGSAVSGGTYTGTITLPVSNPTKSGYAFNGWFVAASGGSALSGSTYTPGSFADITLYAQWNRLYNASFDSNGGTAVAGFVFTKSVTMPAAPSKAGYTFLGWYVGEATSAVAELYEPTPLSDVVFVAHWSKNARTLHFDSQGGSSVADLTFVDQADLSVTSSRNGYRFDGWLAAPGDLQILPTVFKSESIGDVTVYAKWTKVVTLVVSGFADGSPILTAKIKSAIAKFVAKNKGLTIVQCTGYTEGPTVLDSDLKLSKQRGTNACRYVLSLMAGSVSKLQTSAVQLTKEAASNRRVSITLTQP